MKAHIYHFKYPKLQIELIHEELNDNEWTIVEEIKAPNGAFIYANRWYHRQVTHDKLRRPFIRTLPVTPEMVPKEIRAHHLLLGGTA